MTDLTRNVARKSSQGTEDTATYHHGELPATLMTLALEHIQAHGTEKLSLRALAREAGVSPTAPYRHFPSKQCLLAAIAAQGFQTLREEHLRTAAKGLAPEPRLQTMAMSYINFALENPISYQLMFGAMLADFSEYEMLQTAATGAYEEVDRALGELVEARGLDVEVPDLAGAMWAFLHGLSSLLISQPNLGGGDAKPMQALARLRESPERALNLVFGHLIRP